MRNLFHCLSHSSWGFLYDSGSLNLNYIPGTYFTLTPANGNSRTKYTSCDSDLRYLLPSKLPAAGIVARCWLLYLSVEERVYCVFPFNCSFIGPVLYSQTTARLCWQQFICASFARWKFSLSCSGFLLQIYLFPILSKYRLIGGTIFSTGN